MPFLNHRFGSIYGGVILAKLSGSESEIVSLYVNTTNDMPIGLSILLGGGISGLIILFFIGFGIVEIYNLIMKRAALEYRNQMDGVSFFNHNFPEKYLKNCLKLKMHATELDEELIKFCMSKKSQLNISTLIVSAVYTSIFHDNPLFSLNTLRYANRQSNILQRLIIQTKIQEIELNSGQQTTSEIRTLLERQLNLQEKLRFLRKFFWQYFVSNEDDLEKIDSLIHEMFNVQESILSIFNHLMLNYPENQQILKRKQQFFAEFLFENNDYMDAFQNSEIDTKSSSIDLDRSKSFKRSSSKIIPINESFTKKQSFRLTEKVFRDSINTHLNLKKQNIYLLIIQFISILFITGAIITSFIVTSNGSDIITIKNSCQLSFIPHSLLREVKLASHYHSLDYFNYFKSRISTLETFLNKGKMNQYGVLKNTELNYYSQNNFPVIIPTISKNGVVINYQNVSISTMITDLNVIGDSIKNWKFTTLETLNSNYEYLYLELNHNSTSEYLTRFCQSMVNEMISKPSDQLIIVFSTLIGSFSIVFILYLIFSKLFFNTKEKIISLFTKIPKDVVGMIFHSLEKKLSRQKSNENHNISPSFLNFSKKLLLIVVMTYCVSIISLSISFWESMVTDSYSHSVTFKISHMGKFLNSISSEQLMLTNTYLESNTYKYSLQSGLEESWILFRYGSEQYPENVKQFALMMNEVLEDSYTNETSYSNSIHITAISDIYSNTSNNCHIKYACDGLDSLIENYAVIMDSLYSSNMGLENENLFIKLIQINKLISDKIDLLSTYLVSSMIGVRIPISLAIYIIALFLIFINCFFHYSQLNKYTEECNHLRRLLNMLPTDTISHIEEIKQFVLFYNLGERKEKSKTSKSQAILDGAVDGVIVLKTNTTLVEIINQSACKMLGYAMNEITDVMALFGEGEQASKLKLLLDVMFSAKQSIGEYVELEALRKNGSTVAVGVSLSVYMYENKNLVTILLRDITFEKKFKILLEEERRKSDSLLLNILPERIAVRLKAGETCISEKFDDVTCLYSDMVGFTKMSSTLTATELIQLLNHIVNGFDNLTHMFGLEKIKTIGDAYFCVGGMSNQSSDHPEKVILFATHMLSVITKYNAQQNKNLNIRIGIHSGPVIAGCIGNLKFAYDLWGETLTIANSDILAFYLHAIEYKDNASSPVRFGIAKHLVKEYLAENAPKRLKFKYMKNAFGPFQIKFNECNEDNCPVDLFENFYNLSVRALKHEFPSFVKSKIFSKFLEQKKRNPEQLRSYMKGEGESSSADEDDEKEFILFCEKCGTEIINLENHRFNDWEFDNRKELLQDLNQWRVIFETSGGKTYFAPEVSHNHLSNSRRHVQIKYIYDMNCTHHELFNAWIDHDSYGTRIDHLIQSQQIDFVKVGKYAHTVCHEIFKMPFPHKNRELVHAYSCQYDRKEEVYLCISRSINNPKMPINKYRAEIKTAFMVKRLTDTSCRYYYSIIFDPMGSWLKPEWYHKNSYRETQQECFHVKLVKFVDKKQKEGRISNPSGPIVESLNYYLQQEEARLKKKSLKKQETPQKQPNNTRMPSTKNLNRKNSKATLPTTDSQLQQQQQPATSGSPQLTTVLQPPDVVGTTLDLNNTEEYFDKQPSVISNTPSLRNSLNAMNLIDEHVHHVENSNRTQHITNQENDHDNSETDLIDQTGGDSQ
ncbi:predicted protein [Naegleria gruberi]|uniref:Predicted protein n=1 Tax=Naegleria gruberi TaxID=5762 RepID=D2UX70_NAEGR|nr:uncharacterized protein NAEGRDRAFT_45297 [Naegleria gruberi]EFC50877.1 predicted protein [Naegleria gruberi]|eukprot:XP_002683621.1 predicted protein [Naegleria gruberi strain NEG-M]